MPQAKNGDTVKVHYTGKLSNENVFDSSHGKQPIEFKIGDKKLIPGFENAVIGMQPGEKTTITIPSAEAYGPRREDLVIEINRKEIPDHVKPEVGQVLQFQKKPEAEGEKPQIIAFNVLAVTDTHLKLDANHPLAGKDLIFDIELLEIL